jgi:hypothetical protein
MAAPFDTSTTLLTSVSDAVREVYKDGFDEAFSRFGKQTNRLFKFSKRQVNGDGLNIQVKSYNAYPGRGGRDINADFPSAQRFGANKYKVTLDEDTPSNNDFWRAATAAQVSDLDLVRKASTEASAVDFIEETVGELGKNMTEMFAFHRQMDASARLGVVNGTPAKNDNELFASCAALSTTGGARFPIDGGTLAMFPPGLKISVYSGATATKRFDAEIVDYNPVDSSVGIYGLDANGNRSSSVDLTGIADNDEIYIQGERNVGLISIGEWFKTPASSGDDFFGKDRADPINNWLRPLRSGPTSSSTFTKSHLDDLAIQLGYIHEDPEGGMVALTTPELEQAFRDEIGQDIFIQFPSSDQQGKLLAQYGFDGNLYRHPTVGRISLVADPLSKPNRILFVRPGDWETLHVIPGSADKVRWMPGLHGNWNRMVSATANAGWSTQWRMEGYTTACDICTNPRGQAVINNVTA